MRFGIAANPAAGSLGLDERQRRLRDVAAVLGRDCAVAGLDTASPREFRDCARELSRRVDVLVAAGGDGTVQDVINACEGPRELAVLPMGSGNSLRHSLALRGSLVRLAGRILRGRTHPIDLVRLDEGERCLFASVGLEGQVLARRAELLAAGRNGLSAYVRATADALFGGYRRVGTRIEADDEILELPAMLSVVVTKIRTYGYGLQITPRARLDDGRLHALAMDSGLAGAAWGIATSFLGGNRIGRPLASRRLRIATNEPVKLQMGGTLQREGREFCFDVEPGALRLRF